MALVDPTEDGRDVEAGSDASIDTSKATASGSGVWKMGLTTCELSGLNNANANAALLEHKGKERKPWPRGWPRNREKQSQRVLLNASVLPGKSLNRNLFSGFPLGTLLTKTRGLQ